MVEELILMLQERQIDVLKLYGPFPEVTGDQFAVVAVKFGDSKTWSATGFSLDHAAERTLAAVGAKEGES